MYRKRYIEDGNSPRKQFNSNKMMNRKVLGVFGKTLVGGYGVEIKIEADITVLVTYRRSQEVNRLEISLSRTFRLMAHVLTGKTPKNS